LAFREEDYDKRLDPEKCLTTVNFLKLGKPKFRKMYVRYKSKM
jgi:hypothetical protein